MVANIIISNMLAIEQAGEQNWFASFNPRFQSAAAEGTWEQWVELAKEIIKENAEGTDKPVDRPDNVELTKRPKLTLKAQE